MIGAVASMLVPGVSVTKIGKVEKVTEVMTSIAKKKDEEDRLSNLRVPASRVFFEYAAISAGDDPRGCHDDGAEYEEDRLTSVHRNRHPYMMDRMCLR